MCWIGGFGSGSRLRPLARRGLGISIAQVLNPGTSYREALRQVLALFCLCQQDPSDEQTGGYCQARQRLPLNRLQHRDYVAAVHRPLLALEDFEQFRFRPLIRLP